MYVTGYLWGLKRNACATHGDIWYLWGLHKFINEKVIAGTGLDFTK